MCHHKAYHSKWGRHHRHKHGCGRGYHRYKKFMDSRFGMGWMYPPVNVKELDDRYELFVYAPGYAKEDFQVKLKDNTLIIAVDREGNEVVDSPNWRRKEFNPREFRRHFELNEKIDKAAISAQYNDGVLLVTLPKLEGFETSRQDIIVA